MEGIEKYLKAADDNLLYSIRNRMAHIKDAFLIEEEGYIIFSIGIDSLDGHLNGGICLDDSKAEEFLGKIQNIFTPLKRGYAVWVREHDNNNLEALLKHRGLKPLREPGTSCMVCSEKIEKVKIPNGFKLRVIETNKEVEDLASVIAESFDKSEEAAKVMFNLRMISNPRAKAIVVYEKATEKPVAAATTVLSGNTAGIYYVGTLEEYRGRGLGAFIAQESSNIGFDAGAELLILQASELGERVYKKLGYKGISHYRSYRVEL